MLIKEIVVADRPREKLLSKGVEALGDGELLAVLLRCGNAGEGAQELAQRLLRSSGGLVALSALSARELCGLPGLGPAKAATLLAAFELGRRFLSEGVVTSQPSSLSDLSQAFSSHRPILTPRMAYDLMLPLLKGRRNEECWVLFLNVSNYPVGRERVSTGGWNSTTIDVREIVRLALGYRAAGIILVHNHPGGNPRPSQADIRYTEILRKSLSVFDISLQDHVVISDARFFSFSEDRMLSA